MPFGLPAESLRRSILFPLIKALATGLGGAALAAPAPRLADSYASLPGPVVATPADIYGPLFRAVQLERVFEDGKSFADAVPRRDAGQILADYRTMKPVGPAALRRFVLANFEMPTTASATPPAVSAARAPMLAHIAGLWPALVRQPSRQVSGSALPLPSAYVVAAGRARDITYWDSYFTMLGLIRDRRSDLVESMIDDFTALIERYGHIPNGTRSYYLSRSQPPVYYLMLGLSPARDTASFRRRLAALRAEHDYWMAGEDGLRPGQARYHVLKLPDGTLLNRYWDARATPREERYTDDVAAAAASGRSAASVYRELRAGAESGWVFSSRWLGDGQTLATIRTTEIAPADLNSLLAGMERMIAIACERIGDDPCQRDYAARYAARVAALRTRFWDAAGGRFADLDRRTGRPTPILSAATLFPLFVGAAKPDQARIVATTVRRRLLAPGGLRTTTVATDQAWDRPHGWAPLQWIAVEGFRRNGERLLAETIASRWLATVQARYAASGRLVARYDVERPAAGRGDSAMQEGFGWTNGVTRALAADYGAVDAGR